eukprot:363802-Chlamydomonas_euryale.AAC.5
MSTHAGEMLRNADGSRMTLQDRIAAAGDDDEDNAMDKVRAMRAACTTVGQQRGGLAASGTPALPAHTCLPAFLPVRPPACLPACLPACHAISISRSMRHTSGLFPPWPPFLPNRVPDSKPCPFLCAPQERNVAREHADASAHGRAARAAAARAL